MGTVCITFFAESEPYIPIPLHNTFPENIIRILMTDRNSEVAVILAKNIFKHPVLNPPAEKETPTVIVVKAAITDSDIFRPGTGMQSQGCVARCPAAGYRKTPGYLKTDCISIVILHLTIYN